VSAWGWSEEAQRHFLLGQQRARDAAWASSYPEAVDRILLSPEGEPIGRMLVSRREVEIRLVDVALLAAWRDRGIGTRLLEGLVDEAAASGRSLRLQVLVESRARRLYERVGLMAVADDGMYVEMARPAPHSEVR
jgi:GNAT superfamily N-acetyltransferase